MNYYALLCHRANGILGVIDAEPRPIWRGLEADLAFMTYGRLL